MVGSSGVTHRPILTIVPADLQDVLVYVSNYGMGVCDGALNLGNDGADLRDVTMDVRSGSGSSSW